MTPSSVCYIPLLTASRMYENLRFGFLLLPCLLQSIRLSPCTLVKVFLGEITRWDDAEIEADNPDLASNLPNG
jgi:hypothetical protein